MFVVIFRATIGQVDDDYASTSARLRELALTHYGCSDFTVCAQNGEEIALSYWPDQESILAWRNDPEHCSAQQRGSTHWYNGHRVEVAEIRRHYARAGSHGR